MGTAQRVAGRADFAEEGQGLLFEADPARSLCQQKVPDKFGGQATQRGNCLLDLLVQLFENFLAGVQLSVRKQGRLRAEFFRSRGSSIAGSPFPVIRVFGRLSERIRVRQGELAGLEAEFMEPLLGYALMKIGHKRYLVGIERTELFWVGQFREPRIHVPSLFGLARLLGRGSRVTPSKLVALSFSSPAAAKPLVDFRPYFFNCRSSLVRE
jgi:hypothetical protein